MRTLVFYLSLLLAGLSLGGATFATLALARRESRPMTPMEHGGVLGGLLYAAVFVALAYVFAPGTLPPASLLIFVGAVLAGSWASLGARSARAIRPRKGRWVRCTPQEVELRRRQECVARLRVAVLGACCWVMLVTFIRGGGEHEWKTAGFLVALRDTPPRLPYALAAGVGFAILYLVTDRGRGKGTVVCRQCEQAKYEDGVAHCPCGGQFENIKEMKWAEDA
jgi:hypothetical protein